MLGVEQEWEVGQLPKAPYLKLQLPFLDLKEKVINQ